jgi:hypothetical protein
MARSKAQAALEYILATLAFTIVTVGVVGAMSTAAWKKSGVLSDYDVVSGSVNPNTLAGVTLQDGVTVNKTWPGVDASYAGSWQNTQAMPLDELDSDELDPIESNFYASRNSAVPNQGLTYQQQVDAQAEENGGEAFWGDSDEEQWAGLTYREEWSDVDQGNPTEDESEARVNIATDNIEDAVDNGHRTEESLQQSFNQAVASNGASGFVLEDDHQSYTGTWLDRDGHRTGYRPELLSEKGW